MPEPTHDRRAAVRPLADCRDREGDPRGRASACNPANDGKVVRIPLPPLTEERRKELSRHVHKLSEEGRNSVRQVRRDANERLKKFLKDHQISEDDEKKGLDEVQKITDTPHQAHRRPAEEEGRRSFRQVAKSQVSALSADTSEHFET